MGVETTKTKNVTHSDCKNNREMAQEIVCKAIYAQFPLNEGSAITKLMEAHCKYLQASLEDNTCENEVEKS